MGIVGLSWWYLIKPFFQILVEPKNFLAQIFPRRWPIRISFPSMDQLSTTVTLLLAKQNCSNRHHLGHQECRLNRKSIEPIGTLSSEPVLSAILTRHLSTAWTQQDLPGRPWKHAQHKTDKCHNRGKLTFQNDTTGLKELAITSSEQKQLAMTSKLVQLT